MRERAAVRRVRGFGRRGISVGLLAVAAFALSVTSAGGTQACGGSLGTAQQFNTFVQKTVDFDMTRKEYIDKMTPEDKAALEEYKKKTVELRAA